MAKIRLTDDGMIEIIGVPPSEEVLAEIRDRIGPMEAAVVVSEDEMKAFLATLAQPTLGKVE